MGIKRKILLICGNDSSDEHNPTCAQNCQIVGMKKKKQQQQQLSTAATGKKAYDAQTNLILPASRHACTEVW
jgi:hypothetical protein